MKCRRGLAMRILSVRLSVRPSVCLSVTRVIPDKMEERSVQIFIPYERTFSLVLVIISHTWSVFVYYLLRCCTLALNCYMHGIISKKHSMFEGWTSGVPHKDAVQKILMILTHKTSGSGACGDNK